MTVVSAKEFASNQEKYFDMAIHEQVFVQRERDNVMFILTTANDYDNEDSDLALAKLRRNDEMTSSQDFRKFLKTLP